MMKPISISLSPNTEADDIWLAFCLIFQPWKWQKGKEIAELEDSFRNYLGVQSAVAMNSGRSSLMAILQSLELEQGSEVLIQAFTCNAVPNPVQWSGLRPVYVDCQESDFNMDPNDLERKITPKSRAVLVQHTFGIPADLDRITKVCRKHNLILIEDCAHALGASYKGRKVGTFGKAALFSFSRDKVISCVYGGMVATNDSSLALKIRSFQQKVGYPS
ncbi:MAG: aminotransferase class I/II-fold pyridoxal phosphate-dependent enzyme, partial [bacterium]|nr:aminotransferase class I/II-fold pyridoxal phosphate-dependent enzyme [bacterium]